jgi:drug/metabolite transporter (DMT)-like permease
LLAQVLFGVFWSTAFLGAEWAADAVVFEFTKSTIALLIFVAIAPSLIAYRCWGLGVTIAGPAIAAFFANLIPLFTALMSAALLGEPPELFHGLAFMMIVAGIVISSLKKKSIN